MKIFNVLFLSLLIPIGIQAQSNRYYFIEGGTAITAPFNQNFHVTDDNTSTTRYEWKGMIKSLPSYYVRAGLEKSFTMCRGVKISFPISLSYFNLNQNLEMDGGWAGCVGGFYGHQSISQTNHTGRIAVGFKQILNFGEKMIMQNSINFSNSLLICTENKVKETNESGVHGYYNTQWLRKIDAALSLQTGLFYQVGKSSTIGVTAEYFFRHKTIMPAGKNYYWNTDFGWGINSRNTLLTVGIRLQYSF